jgi:hypothetical protein
MQLITDFNKIEDEIVSIIEDASGKRVIWELSDTLAPQGSYISLAYVNPMNFVTQFFDVKAIDDDTSEFSTIAELVLSVKIIHKDVYDAKLMREAASLAAQLNEPDTQKRLRPLGVALINISNVRDISLNINEEYYLRFQFDMTFYFNFKFLVKTSTIKNVQISQGHFYDFNNSLIHEVNKLIST